jgi:hypothetical protein
VKFGLGLWKKVELIEKHLVEFLILQKLLGSSSLEMGSGKARSAHSSTMRVA